MTPQPADAPTTITAYPDGPLLLRGPAVIVGEDGRALERRQGAVALCRCGRSSIAPFCDGTHKVLQRAAARRARRRLDTAAGTGPREVTPGDDGDSG
jgi:CDGSH-type Zn-finger protein